MKLINYQPAEIIQLEQESRRIWMTDIYSCKFFNGFVRGQIENDLMKKVIINEMSGSNWRFKRFDHITMIVSRVDEKSIVF